ncbi:transcriptional regulator AfsR [Kutzneria viridogrisea]|uniref:DNA-binding SARP family transcriptional activator n=1 Tax=Kutzneria viridogrisea TaxID=47990 RepID=A0ABR6B8W5_9PSEU|nr:DNA-binding SARP family transcriptional activator [Kutzneria viridogrisea]
MLLLASGQAVSTAELVDGVWGDNPPTRAISAVRTYVYRLRRALEPNPVGSHVLRSVGDGYALDIAVDALDAKVFERQVIDARQHDERGRVAEAADLLSGALALYRGEPLAGVPGPYAQAQRTRLVEQRLMVLEDRLDLDLMSGRHAQIVGELAGLVTAHPLRERMLAQRMVALYRCGQPTMALDGFGASRRHLVAELGVEPGPLLRELHQQILAGNDIAYPPGRSPITSGQRLPRPAQLPAAVPDFTGRAAIVEQVAESVLASDGSTMPTSVISGLGGVGKTALAVYVAHRVKAHFPDGQLYVDLHGVDEEPARPQLVLNSFLGALGIGENAVPAGLDERAALLRSVLAGRKVLLVLDNAHDAGQVAPLLPGTGGCAVLVTSRSRIASLPGARTFELPVFDTDEALTLLRRVVGPRTATPEPAARAVVDACGNLPLAVRISASRLASRPNWTLPLLAERLSDQCGRLDELRLGDVAVANTFRLGYDQLDSESAHAFRLLSISGLHGFSRYSAAAMLDRPPAVAERLCEQLVDLSLLESVGPGRYRYHDLVRLYACDRARESEPSGDRVAALTRLLDFHLTVAITTTACGLSTGAVPMSLAADAHTLMPLADMSATRTWLTSDAEGHGASDTLYRLVQSVELDSIAGFDALVGRMLCASRDPAVAEAAPGSGSPTGRPLLALDRLARIDIGLARVRASCAQEDSRTLSQIAFVAAVAATMRQQLDVARACYQRVFDLSRDAGDVRGEVLATAGLGRTAAMLGDMDAAYALAEKGVSLSRDHADQHAEAFAMHVFVQIAQLRGDDEHAAALRAEVVRLWLAAKQPVPGETNWMPSGIFDWSQPETGVGAWLGLLGHALADLDQGELARACWHQASELLAGLGHSHTVELRSLVNAAA